ncbi:21384_t:CDS:2 [Entrophospora sp. SA101]|nr:21384_t:CDS:2 [Entrophospora sp. SA101]
MVGIKKRTQHLKIIAKISVHSRQEKQKIPEDNEIYDSANSDDFEEMISYFDEEFENNSESLFQLLINNMKNYKAKRPLTYHGNSTRTQKRRKHQQKKISIKVVKLLINFLYEISSFLREEKFNVTVNNFKEFIAKDVFPSIGVENETAIR